MFPVDQSGVQSSIRDSSASPTKLRRRKRSKSREEKNSGANETSQDKFRLDQSGSSSSEESEDEGLSEDEYSYSCVVYSKADQEMQNDMDTVRNFQVFNPKYHMFSAVFITLQKLSLKIRQ